MILLKVFSFNTLLAYIKPIYIAHHSRNKDIELRFTGTRNPQTNLEMKIEDKVNQSLKNRTIQSVRINLLIKFSERKINLKSLLKRE